MLLWCSQTKLHLYSWLINLSKGKSTVPKNLRNQNDFIIKAANKGGAVASSTKKRNLATFRRHLLRLQSQQRPDDSQTKNCQGNHSGNDNLIKTLATTHIDIITIARTSCICFRPHIRKCNNLGHPIVSASHCPPEFISSYVPKIMAPIVR